MTERNAGLFHFHAALCKQKSNPCRMLFIISASANVPKTISNNLVTVCCAMTPVHEWLFSPFPALDIPMKPLCIQITLYSPPYCHHSSTFPNSPARTFSEPPLQAYRSFVSPFGTGMRGRVNG